jgi:hypothetical protein
MMQAWELFFQVWERSVAAVVPAAGERAATLPYVRQAEAISSAGAETVRHLRDGGGWSLLNSHLVAARLVEVASEWLERDGLDRERLRLQLQAVRADEGRTEGEESERRRVTEAVLAGARSRSDTAAAL